VHLDEDVAGEEPPGALDLAAAALLDDVFRGIRTSPISLCSPYAATRCSSDSFTLFSKPE